MGATTDANAMATALIATTLALDIARSKTAISTSPLRGSVSLGQRTGGQTCTQVSGPHKVSRLVFRSTTGSRFTEPPCRGRITYGEEAEAVGSRRTSVGGRQALRTAA